MLHIKKILCFLVCGVLGFTAIKAQDLQVIDFQKISATAGNFLDTLDNNDRFGGAVNGIGDWDGDGVEDILVGATLDDDGGTNLGAFYIVLLNTDGTVKSSSKVSQTQGNFMETLNSGGAFGNEVDTVGDMDGDGVMDLVIGNGTDSDGNTRAGALWILFMNANGTVKASQKVSQTTGGLAAQLDPDARFGVGLSCIGDLDGDGVNDLAVGAEEDQGANTGRGSVYILFMNSNGTVKSKQVINNTQGGFTGQLDFDDRFGIDVAYMGDIDGDGVQDIAVGARLDDDGGQDKGACYILFLNTNGTVKSHQKISDLSGGFGGNLSNNDYSGNRLANLGDLDGNGVNDMAYGAYADNDAGSDAGAIYILLLESNGMVKKSFKITENALGFTGDLDGGDNFGWGLGSLGDLDGNGVNDVVIGAGKDDDGGTDRGGVWVVFLDVTSLQAAFIPHDTTICAGETIQFTNQSQDATQYDWRENGINFSFAPNPSLQFNVIGTYAIDLIASDGNLSDTATHIVHVVAEFNISVSATLCQGDSIYAGGGWQTSPGIYIDTLMASTGCDSIITSVVSVGSSVMTTLYDTLCVGDSLFIGGMWVTESGVYYDTLAAQFGCDSIVEAHIHKNDIGKPEANAGANRKICLGDTIPMGASGGATYVWTPTTGLSNPTIPTPLAYPSVTTTYTVTVSNSCGVDTDSMTITVNPLPTANAGPDVTILQGDSVQLMASGGSQYYWTPSTYLSNHQIANPLASPYQTMQYVVTVHDANDCMDKDTVVVVVEGNPNGIVASLENGLEIGFYPVPFVDQLFVHYDLQDGTFVRLQFYDVLGAAVQQVSLSGGHGHQQINFHEALPAGVYLCKIMQDDKTLKVIKLVKGD